MSDFVLDAEVEKLPALGNILDEPALLLEAAFRGKLSLNATLLQGVAVGWVTTGPGTAGLELAVHATEGSRRLELDKLAFSLSSAEPLTFSGGFEGVSLSDVTLNGTLEGWDLREARVRGGGRIALPDVLGGVLNGAPTGWGARANFELRHSGGGRRSTSTSTTLPSGRARPSR